MDEKTKKRKNVSPKRIYLCKAEGCNKQNAGGGYCFKHGGGRRCEVEDCTKSVQGKGNLLFC